MKTAFLELFPLVHARLPDFAPYKLKDEALIRGRDLVVHRRVGEVLHFVALVRHMSMSKVTVEVGWSANGRFPNVSPRPCMDLPDPAVTYPEYVFRLRCGKAGAECWWRLDDASDSERVNELADEIVSKLVKEAFPLLPSASGPAARKDI